MKKSKFTEEQIAFALKQAESGTTVEERPEADIEFLVSHNNIGRE